MKKIGLFFIFMLMFCWFAFAAIGFAATTNPATGAPGYTPMVIPIFGSNTSTRISKVSFKAPSGYTIQHASAVSRVASGTNPTLKIRGKNSGFVSYSGTVASGSTPTDLKLASGAGFTDEGLQTVDLVIGGTSPIWSDITLFLFLRRQ